MNPSKPPATGNDPLGHALLDYMKGEKQGMIKVFSDLASDDSMQVKYFFRPYQDWPKLERMAVDLCRGRVLEVGAGAGSHALFLQDKGLDVTALDISKGAVQVMKDRGLKKVLNKDILHYKDKSYDSVLMLMNGIGLVGNLAGLRTYLVHAFNNLIVEGGQLIFDSSNLVYLFEDDEADMEFWPGRSYYGEVHYWMSYKGKRGPKFGWLFVDFETLKQEANNLSLKAELVKKNEHFAYLARITNPIF